MQQGEKLYKIGEMAEILGVHIQTLRIYDRQNLLSPKRTDTNRRGYTDDDIEHAKLILYLTRELNVNLNGVKIILAFLKKNRLNSELGLELLKTMAKSLGIIENEPKDN